ncbi:hypothetical protein [Planktothricoides raciborskii]|uniref:Uncharacterized protein n=1 Tax=Planktothricoides raciborskii GIHE-MW2 TaxID=2792601 RepID=A0AAU8JAR6_9CYAN
MAQESYSSTPKVKDAIALLIPEGDRFFVERQATIALGNLAGRSLKKTKD